MANIDPENQEAISTGDQMSGGQDQPANSQPVAPQQQAAPQAPNPKMIASMLLGQGAMPLQAIDQAGKRVDPQGHLGEDDRNLLALHQVAQTQGPQAAWALMQTHRLAYNAKQSLGYAALQKGNIHAAVDAANQASSHVLDGSNVKFHVAGSGSRQ